MTYFNQTYNSSYNNQQSYSYQYQDNNTTPFGELHNVEVPYTDSWRWELPSANYSGSYNSNSSGNAYSNLEECSNNNFTQQLSQYFLGGCSSSASASASANGSASASASANNGFAFAYASSGNSFAFAGSYSGSSSSQSSYGNNTALAGIYSGSNSCQSSYGNNTDLSGIYSGSNSNQSSSFDLASIISFLSSLMASFSNNSNSVGSYSGSSCQQSSEPVAANETGKIWGDPHFVGADGGKYDVQGQAGKSYNLLSDRGLQFNGTFGAYGDGGATVVKDTAINVGGPCGQSQVKFSADGKATVNNQELKDGQSVRLADGGTAILNGNKLTVTTAEGYTIEQTKQDGYINADVKTGANGVAADGVLPHGLLGQTFDADKEARNGKTGAGAQGEGAIDGKVTDYEVNSLNDTSGKSPVQNNNNYPQSQQNGMMQMFMQFLLMILSMFGMQGQQNNNYS